MSEQKQVTEKAAADHPTTVQRSIVENVRLIPYFAVKVKIS